MCNHTGCNAFTTEAYCDRHKREALERHKEYDQSIRDKRSQEFYGSSIWIKMRDYVIHHYNGLDLYDLFINNKITAANTVHHIIELKEDWNLRIDFPNLLPVSESNHSVIHQLYKKDKKGTQAILYELIENYDKMFGVGGI